MEWSAGPKRTYRMNESLKAFIIQNNIQVIGDIKWAHAVNDVKFLDKVLSDSKIDFIEVDISLYESNEPIAAHYQNISDLSVVLLLNKVKYSNKGLKLDFKDPAVITPTLNVLKENALNQPVILNADILSVKGALSADIEPEGFIKNCQEYYPSGILSLGWRTEENSVYSEGDVEKMLAVCKDLEEVIFPVRASSLPGSWKNVKKLIEKEGHTLTIWSSGPIGTKLKDWIIKNTDPNKCFYDLGL